MESSPIPTKTRTRSSSCLTCSTTPHPWHSTFSFGDDLGKERRIEITHRFCPPTAADAIAYERTSKMVNLEGGARQNRIKYGLRA